MSKPATRPDWATSGSITVPSGAKIAAGFAGRERGAAQYFNYLFNLIGQWIDWLDGAHTYVGTQALTAASGTYTPSANVKAVRVRMIAGGGGGGPGASNTNNQFSAGGGGASGTYFEKWITPGALVTGGAYVCGAAGAAGVGNGGASTAGGNGGDTTIVIQGTTYTAKGGGGGNFLVGGIVNATTNGGTLQAGTTAGDRVQTDLGAPGLVFGGASGAACGGAGGNGMFGCGGPAVSSFGLTAGNSIVGNDGTGNGSGGSGGVIMGNGAGYVNVNGGLGTIGKILVDEYT